MNMQTLKNQLTNQLSVKLVKKEAISEDGDSVGNDSNTSHDDNKFKLQINHCFVEELCTCELAETLETIAN